MLTKHNLIEKLYQNPRLMLKHKKDAREIVDCIFQEILLNLQKGEKVRLDGIGTFYLKHCPARIGRNPKTGEQVTIPEQNRVRFKSSKVGDRVLRALKLR